MIALINTLKKLIGLLQVQLAKKNGQLLPLVERKRLEFFRLAEMKGYTLRMVWGYRTFKEQNVLYAKGRTMPGNIVTKAKGGESLHNYSVAFDVVDRYRGYDIDWYTLGVLAESLGIKWGGRWKSFPDKPHFQMTQGYHLQHFMDKLVKYSEYA